MRKFVFLLFILLSFTILSFQNALAQKIYYNLSAVGISGNDDNITGLHDQWGVYARSENIINLGPDLDFSAGDNFTNIGMLKISSLLTFLGGSISDDEGLNTNYEITAYWENLTGSVNNVTDISSTLQYLTFSYDGGIVITFYIDSTPDFDTTFDFNTGFTNSATATDGIPILDITIDGGTGSILQEDTDNNGVADYVRTASATLYGRVTKVYQNNFIFFEDYGDFYELIDRQVIFAFTDWNADNFDYDFGDFPPNVRTIADHNGSLDFAVPEPATIVLVGSGLLILGVTLRKRNNIKN